MNDERTHKETVSRFMLYFPIPRFCSLWDMSMGLVCMVILVLMKKLKEFVDPKLKTETNKVKKILYKIVWLLCTGKIQDI